MEDVTSGDDEIDGTDDAVIMSVEDDISGIDEFCSIPGVVMMTNGEGVSEKDRVLVISVFTGKVLEEDISVDDVVDRKALEGDATEESEVERIPGIDLTAVIKEDAPLVKRKLTRGEAVVGETVDRGTEDDTISVGVVVGSKVVVVEEGLATFPVKKTASFFNAFCSLFMLFDGFDYTSF